MKPVKFLAAAREDIRREKSYYRAVNPELARRFQAEVEMAVISVSEQPLAMEELEFEIRRWPLEIFPHGVLYRVEKEFLLVLAVFHPSQSPENGDCGRAHNSLQQTPKPLCGLGSLLASRSGAAELKRLARRNEIAVNPKIVIRNETSADVGAIAEVTIAAFNTLAISNHTEQFIIDALRAAKALTISLVAKVDGRLVGHIAFSPVAISDGIPRWYGLGPVSVLPEYQRKGIGKALIQEGLSRLKDLNAEGCCLVGHPEYYRRFGFENIPGLVLEGVPQEVFLALSFDGRYPQGEVTFHDGFKADGQQSAKAL